MIFPPLHAAKLGRALSNPECQQYRTVCEDVCASFHPKTLKCKDTVHRCDKICVRFTF